MNKILIVIGGLVVLGIVFYKTADVLYSVRIRRRMVLFCKSYLIIEEYFKTSTVLNMHKDELEFLRELIESSIKFYEINKLDQYHNNLLESYRSNLMSRGSEVRREIWNRI